MYCFNRRTAISYALIVQPHVYSSPLSQAKRGRIFAIHSKKKKKKTNIEKLSMEHRLDSIVEHWIPSSVPLRNHCASLYTMYKLQ